MEVFFKFRFGYIALWLDVPNQNPQVVYISMAKFLVHTIA